MRRATDPRLGILLAFLAGALLLVHGALAGGAALIRRYGFGLAEPWEMAKAEDPLLIEELLRSKDDDLQIVEIERPTNEEEPEDAKFRSEWSSKVEKETQGRIKGLAPLALASLERQPPTEALQPSPETSQETSQESRPAPDPEVHLVPEPDRPPHDQQPPPTPPGPAPSPERQPSPLERKLTLRNLTPSNGSLEKAIPTAFPDYLKDIDFGDQTLLNTKEFQFASFFNRVKRAVAENWHPDKEYSRRDPHGNVYGFKTRMTVLHVLLNPDGTLHRLVLERPSGLGFLDDEAMRAFKKAAPFPNPPRRLVSSTTGLIAFRFGFIFELSRSPSWRILRLK